MVAPHSMAAGVHLSISAKVVALLSEAGLTVTSTGNFGRRVIFGSSTSLVSGSN